MNRFQSRKFILAVGLGMFCAGPLRADTIELTNGDVLNGNVVSLDGKELILKSELLGELKLAREKISAIHLGEGPVLTRPSAPAANPPAAPAQPASIRKCRKCSARCLRPRMSSSNSKAAASIRR